MDPTSQIITDIKDTGFHDSHWPIFVANQKTSILVLNIQTIDTADQQKNAITFSNRELGNFFTLSY